MTEIQPGTYRYLPVCNEHNSIDNCQQQAETSLLEYELSYQTVRAFILDTKPVARIAALECLSNIEKYWERKLEE